MTLASVLPWQIAFFSTLALAAVGTIAEPVPVEVRNTQQGWQLFRDNQPYFIRGAGGNGSLKLLAANGGNSIRTWSVSNAGEVLDQAHSHGLTVTLGIWMGHERHGFDYSDPVQVAIQLERAKQNVMKYKDHPALLMWAVGNEMEGFGEGDNVNIWKAVNDIAAMIKKLDPVHPTLTVTADVGGERVRYVHKFCNAIDIHGINSYGGALSLKQRLEQHGATKPYILTEFGPPGAWEAPKTGWGAPLEQTSTQKADFYRRSYHQAILPADSEPNNASLGSYAFLWGSKVEATSTWFGMFLKDGSRLESVTAMSDMWSRSASTEFSPAVQPLQIEGDATRMPSDTIRVSTTFQAKGRNNLQSRWELRPESGDYQTGGDFRRSMPAIEEAIVSSSLTTATIKLPVEPGPYRVFYFVLDKNGNAATANVPLLVKGQRQTRFPVNVFTDGFEGMPWAPSGWMGNTEALILDGDDTSNPKSGRSSVRLRYRGEFGWVGVAWQNPPNNWGDQAGGFDLSGATALELWARGAYGGETISIGVGLIDDNKAHADSVIEKSNDIVLASEWQKLRIPLLGADLSSIKTGFVVVINGRQSPVTVFLDDIRYVK